MADTRRFTRNELVTVLHDSENEFAIVLGYDAKGLVVTQLLDQSSARVTVPESKVRPNPDPKGGR